MLQTSSSRNSETCSIASSIISQSSGIGQIVSLNEDEALKLILKTHSDMDEQPVEALEEDSRPPTTELKPIPAVNLDNTDQQVQSNSLGNILKEQSSGWSYDKTNDVPETPEEKMERSYSSLVESNFLNGTHIRTPDFRDVLHRLNNDSNDESQVEENAKSSEEQNTDDEKPTKTDEIPTTPTKTISLTDQVTLLGNERGLDAQDYKCFACKKQFSLTNKIMLVKNVLL